MPATVIRLDWIDLSETEDGFRVYRSSEPFDTDNLPPVKETLLPNTETYTDEDVQFGDAYYYMVSVFNDEEEVFSPLKKVVVREDILFVSVTGSTHMVTSTGEPFNTTPTDELFPNIMSSAANFEMDTGGNYYIMDNVGISKYDASFTKQWTIGVSSRNTLTSFYVNILNELVVATRYNLTDRVGVTLDAGSGTVFKFNSDGDLIVRIDPAFNSTPFATGTSYYNNIIGTVDPEICYVLTDRNIVRCDFAKNTIDMSYSAPARGSSNNNLVVDKNFNVYCAVASRIEKLDQWLNLVKVGPSISTVYGGIVISGDGKYIYLTNNSDLIKIDTETMQQVGSVRPGTSLYDLNIDSNDDLYVRNGSNTFFKVSGETMEILWEYVPAKAGTFHYLTVPPNRSYFASGLTVNEGEPL